MKAEKVQVVSFDAIISELRGIRESFQIEQTSTENILIHPKTGVIYVQKNSGERLGTAELHLLKKAQGLIIKHIDNSPHLHEGLKTRPEIMYTHAKIFDNVFQYTNGTGVEMSSTDAKYQKSEQLVQIDLKSAYVCAAEKLGLLPPGFMVWLTEELNKIVCKYTEKGIPIEEAKARAKKVRLVLLGSLAKKKNIIRYDHKTGTDEYVDTETGELSSYHFEHYDITQFEERKNGEIISNVFFAAAKAITDLMLETLREVDEACFFWVDALFCLPSGVGEVARRFYEAGYKFEVYEPQPAVYTNFTYYIKSPEATEINMLNPASYKFYQFTKNNTKYFLGFLDDCLTSLTAEHRLIKKANSILQENIRTDANSERNYQESQIWARVERELKLAGIKPNDPNIKKMNLVLEVEYTHILPTAIARAKYLINKIGEFADRLQQVYSNDSLIQKLSFSKHLG